MVATGEFNLGITLPMELAWYTFSPLLQYELERSILCPSLFPLFINDFPGDVICNIAVYADDTNSLL